MDFINGIMASYAHFFSLQDFLAVIGNPMGWSMILSLVILEGLLSADNALVLAVVVKHLPEDLRKKALFYGIFGAYLFRFIAIGLGTFLVKLWFVKLIGAAYLLWLAYQHFAKGDGDDEVEETNFGFWRTVAIVEGTDIAFSMDSVLAAFGVSDQVWILFLGGILGILMMRGVAQLFIKLLDAYPELGTTAYILIAMIGAKMLASVFGYAVKDIWFFTLMAIVFCGTFVVHNLKIRMTYQEDN